jgi:hypothetical protein
MLGEVCVVLEAGVENVGRSLCRLGCHVGRQ